MPLIHVPRPDRKTTMDPNRPVNALLKAQVQHLQDAELKLPALHQTNIYPNAIKTEGEAAEYIQRVTAAIHDAHNTAAARRAKPLTRRKRGLEIAAAASDRPVRKRAQKKRSMVKRRRKS